jgi:putative ABC transport system permease protein
MNILKLLYRNTFRKKLRTSLTILGITIAILSFGLLRTVVSAWYAGVEASSATRLVTRNAISLVFLMPLSYKEKIRHIDSVTKLSYGNWFGGVYIEEKNFFPNFAVDHETYFDLYPEFLISANHLAAFKKDRKGVIAGEKIVKKFGWKLGDPIVLKGTIMPGNWEFILRGIYRGRDKGTDETQFFFHWDYMNETVKKTSHGRADKVGFYVIGIADPDRAAAVSLSVDNTFRNTLAETLTETEKAFQLGFVSMSEAIVIVIQLVSMVIIIIILAVVANTMAMTARERTGEYAVFKTLGFGKWRIAGLIFGESLFITIIGCGLGIILTFPVVEKFGKAMSTYFPVFHVAPETIILDIIATLFVGSLAAVVPTYQTLRNTIAEGLRGIG